MPIEGFKDHVATDGSLLGKAGKWRACGWAVVQSDYDEEMEPLLGMYGSMEAAFELQRTMKRAELTAFKVNVENKGIIDGLRRGWSKCIKPRTGGADLWSKVWEKYMVWQKGDILVEVELKAHRTKKEKKYMSHLEKFVTVGNEKADELAKEGALLDEGCMAEARAETFQQEREEVFAALQCAPSFHCLVEQWKDCEELKPKRREKWNDLWIRKGGDEASDRMVCGSSLVSMHEMWKRKQILEDARKMCRTTIIVKKLEK